jgi:hypothetical protein
MNLSKEPKTPWYREPWPWILMALPLSAVIASFASLFIAISHPDPLVTEHAWEDGKRLEQSTKTDK